MSAKFTRWSHLLRLGIIAAAGLVGFITFRIMATPPSWNTEVWYRADSLKEIRDLPQAYGGNASCNPCHGQELSVQLGPGHLGLSCESCHGALADHVTGEIKTGDAVVITESEWQCMNCHREQINRPANFPTYRYQHSENRVRRQKSERGGRYCLDCHDPHTPELEGPVI